MQAIMFKSNKNSQKDLDVEAIAETKICSDDIGLDCITISMYRYNVSSVCEGRFNVDYRDNVVVSEGLKNVHEK